MFSLLLFNKGSKLSFSAFNTPPALSMTQSSAIMRIPSGGCWSLLKYGEDHLQSSFYIIRYPKQQRDTFANVRVYAQVLITNIFSLIFNVVISLDNSEKPWSRRLWKLTCHKVPEACFRNRKGRMKRLSQLSSASWGAKLSIVRSNEQSVNCSLTFKALSCLSMIKGLEVSLKSYCTDESFSEHNTPSLYFAVRYQYADCY